MIGYRIHKVLVVENKMWYVIFMNLVEIDMYRVDLMWMIMRIYRNVSIAQISPLGFQGSHRTHTQTSEVRWLRASVVTEWSPACLHKQFPGDLHRSNWRKPHMEDVHNLINIGPTNPIQIVNQHEIFWRFCMCNSNDTFDKNKKYWSRYWD